MTARHRHFIPLLLVFAGVYLANAWVCDDAYITFRTIDNLVNGLGPVWNAGERVQAFTHPLWFLLLSAGYALTSEIYYTSLAISAMATLSALYLVAGRIALWWEGMVLSAALLISSKAFVDYASSGLEDPLTYLLVALFVYLYMRHPNKEPSVRTLAMVAGLATLNRMDTLLLFAPALLLSWWPQRSLRSSLDLACGFVPFVMWELFSIAYYGFPFPNTAYAKLGTGIPQGELLVQGLRYAQNSLRLDPITLPTMGVALAYVVWKPRRRTVALGIGILLYVLYALAIGGHFMSGRLFAAPFLMAVAVLGRSSILARRRAFPIAIVLLLAVNLSTPHAPIWSDSSYGLEKKGWFDVHIANERAFYYPYTGLLNALANPDTTFPIQGWADWGRKFGELADGGLPTLITWPQVGFIGFYSGPQCPIIDIHALGDPLLARLPARRDVPWRIGHFARIIPVGYVETHLYGENLIEDPDLALFYDKLRVVISEELFTAERAREIWRLNTGYYDHLIDEKAFAYTSSNDVSRTNALTSHDPWHSMPSRIEHHLGLGDIFLGRKDFLRAIMHYRKGLDVEEGYVRRYHPQDYQAVLRRLHLNLARALIEIGKTSIARIALKTFAQRFPTDEVVLDALAELDHHRADGATSE